MLFYSFTALHEQNVFFAIRLVVSIHTCNVVRRRFIVVVVVVVVVVTGCDGSEPDVLAVEAVRWTECQALERSAAASDTLQLLVDGQVVINAAQKSVVTESELVTGNQLTTARHAPETVDVVDVTARAHHQIRHAKTELTAGTFSAE